MSSLDSMRNGAYTLSAFADIFSPAASDSAGRKQAIDEQLQLEPEVRV